MLKKELCAIGKLYAISPVHAGSGAATSAVDLPIQRERHTEWPQIQASGVKGAFRNHFRRFNAKEKDLINLIFGSDEQDGWAKNMDMLPGAVSISDARLLAFPVRSNIAPFVWITSPAVLKRFNADLAYIGSKVTVTEKDIQEEGALSIGTHQISGQVILEDAVSNVIKHQEAAFVKPLFPELERLLLVSDEMYKYAVTCCTEVQTHIKINEKTGTADDGALWYQEYLPADSLLYTLVHYSHREGGESSDVGVQAQLAELKAATIRQYVEETISGYVQIGGDETLGKGIFKLTWLEGGDA